MFVECSTIAVIVDVLRTHSAEELGRSLGKGNMILVWTTSGTLLGGTGAVVHMHSMPGQISAA